MLTTIALLVSAALAKNCASGGLLLVASSVAIFLLAFRGARTRPGADWRLIVFAIAVFFIGGILLIFGIVGTEVAQRQPGR